MQCRPLTLAVLCAGFLACVSARTRSEWDEVRATAAEPPPTSKAEDAASLAQQARLAVVERLALTDNPDVIAARARLRAALERAKSVTHLPDLELKYELWQQPLAHPLSPGMAAMHMFGIRQVLPPLGSLDAKGRMALEEAKMELEATMSVELDLVARVRTLYAGYVSDTRERKVHDEHAVIASALVDLARSTYGVGKGAPEDVLRVTLETTRVHGELIEVDARLARARVELNTLMNRAADAPLGPPDERDVLSVQPPFADLEKKLEERRPEVAAALDALHRSEASLDEANARAHWPTFMIGADYMYMPTGEMHHAYGAMFSLTLPWLNPAHGEQVAAAEQEVAADKAALAAIQRTLVLQLREAKIRFDAAKSAYALVDHDLLPLATHTFEAARASYAVGGGNVLAVLDAFRSWVDARVQRARALARVEAALADVERAAGLGPGEGKKP